MRLPFLLLLGAVGLLSGCVTEPDESPSEQVQKPRTSKAAFHEVAAGETLYSIAWEAGQDYRDVAAWNRIPAPYTIRPGQRISLQPPADVAQEIPKPEPAPSMAAPAVRIYVVRRGDSLHRIAKQQGVKPGQLAAWNGLRKPFRLYPGQKLKLASPAATAKKPGRRPTSTKTTAKEPRKAPTRPAASLPETVRDPAPASAGTWTWPTRGNIIERFNASSARKGIDIAGPRGQAIVASAPGSVVYQGSGLRGYGQLIIIKHNEDFLSAYAHCQKITVKEGESVKRGQKIAEMGSTGTDRNKLHFEIRYRGKPVDPLKYLPGKP